MLLVGGGEVLRLNARCLSGGSVIWFDAMMPSWDRYEPYDLCLQGRVFSVSFEGSISAGATSWAQVKTNANKVTVIHYDLIAVTENMTMTVYEAPTITNGTNAVVPVNLNRNSAATATAQFFTNPTSVSGGTFLLVSAMPSGANKVGGVAGHNETWGLLPDTSYGIKMVNSGNSTTTVVFSMLFFEH